MPSEPGPESAHVPTASGFGRVLSSIQGLQQRLGDFSLEEASRAEKKARTVVHELGLLQARLTAIAKLSGAVASVNEMIATLPEVNFDPVGPDSLEKHPQLRAIVQAAKLIRMHRLLRAAQASAESISLDFQTGESNRHPSSTQTLARTPTAPLEALPSSVSEAAVKELPEYGLRGNTAPVKTEIAATPEQVLSSIANGSLAQSAPVLVTYTDLRLEEGKSHSSRNDDFPEPVISAAERTANKEDKTAPSKTHFDERLLNDLIETYGEFAFSSRAGGSEASRVTGRTEPVGPPRSVDAATVEARPVRTASNRAPTAVRALPAPEFERPQSRAAQLLPGLKTQGEIDRQLKSIIRDYGEYDLYSHQKSMNYTTAAIAAFAVLGLVLGGFYFFKSPPPPVPAAVEIMPASRTGMGTSDRQTGIGEQPSRPQQNVAKQRN